MFGKFIGGKTLFVVKLNRFSIKQQLFYGFGLVLSILLLLSIVSFVNFNWVMKSNQTNIATYQFLADLDVISKSITEMESGHLGFLMTGDPKLLDSFESGKKDFDRSFQRVIHSTTDPKLKKFLFEINDTQGEWHSYAQSVNELRRNIAENGNIDAIIRIVKARQGKQYTDQIAADAAQCKKIELNLLAKRMDHSNQLKIQTNLMLLLGTVIAIFLGMFIAYLIIKMITGGISHMVSAADKLALGDVNVTIDLVSQDEMGVLARSFNKMAISIREQSMAAQKIAAGNLQVEIHHRSKFDMLAVSMNQMVTSLQDLMDEANQLSQAIAHGQLDKRGNASQFKGVYYEIILGMNQTLDAVNELIFELSNTAQQVATGSKQVASSAATLSEGAMEQAASLEEISASISEILLQTKHNDDNANRANQLVAVAKEHADNGNEQMAVMVKAMDEIKEASMRIANIMKELDDVASQTNILALNAAIEAARAGAHGKGFAVVAQEVRELAARSTNAVKETAAIIKRSMDKVEDGTRVAGEMAQSLNKIVESVSGVRNLVADIVVASNQQTESIAQMNSGIEQVSRVTQGTSVSSEESAAISEELSNQAEQLKIMVGRFQIHSNPTGMGNLRVIHK
jgi:methyl-accepting chemotaxis protein